MLERICEEHDAKWCMSMWKYGYNDYMTRKHKHVHGKKRRTKYHWAANPFGTMKWKTTALRTLLAPWNERPLGCVPFGTRMRWKRMMSMHSIDDVC
jgi:hypothetical protein